MKNIKFPNFGFKGTVASSVKRNKDQDRRMSLLVQGVVISRNNDIFVQVNDDPKLIFPLTEKSLDPKGKSYLFRKNTESDGKHILRIFSEQEAIEHSPTSDAYITLLPGCIIAGHVVRKNSVNYFKYEHFIGPNKNQKLNKVNGIKNENSNIDIWL